MCFIFYREFLKPKPPVELVTSGIDALHAAILENISSKKHAPTIISFRHDIFRHLFYNKGTTSDYGRYILMDEKDFSRCSWPEKWDQILDHLGDGVKICYPVKMRLFLGRSPKNHVLVEGGTKELPQYYIEKLSIHCLKKEFAESIFY